MTSMHEADLVHHLLHDPRTDLLPYCGTAPGRDQETGDWHAVHDRDLLIECVEFGLCCCSTCLSPEALGGWTPLIFDDVREQEESEVPEDQWWID